MSWAWPLDVDPCAEKPAIAGVSARLAAVATLARTRGGLADIGTDHGRLPVAMVHAGWADFAVAIDRAEAPLMTARARVDRAGLGDRISVRLGAGLGPLRPGEVDTVVVAGVGGQAAVEVLDAPALAALGVRRIVVQPNRDDAVVRARLAVSGWRVRDERLVYDTKRLFYVLAAEPGPPVELGPFDRWLGPVLRHRRDPLAEAFFRIRMDWLRRVRRPDDPTISKVLSASARE